ncbi:MAG: hypothetical protein VW804_10165, partial [Verrucomicrobiota bacterium]
MDQEFRGDFALRVSRDLSVPDTSWVLLLMGEHVEVDFADGLVSATGGEGAFVIKDGQFAGTLNVEVDVNLGDISFDGDFSLSFNTSEAVQNTRIPWHSEPGYLDYAVAGGPHLRVSATEATLELGGQLFTGNFSLEVDASGDETQIYLAAWGVEINLNSGGEPLLNLTNGSGYFVVLGGGLAGRLEAILAVPEGQPFEASGRVSVAFNSLSSAVDETLLLHSVLDEEGGPTQVSLQVDAGPLLQVEGEDLLLRFNDQAFRGNFSFTANNDYLEVSGSELHTTVSVDGVRLNVEGGAGRFYIGSADGGVLGGATFQTIQLQGVNDVSLLGTDIELTLRTQAVAEPTLASVDHDGNNETESLTIDPAEHFKVSGSFDFTIYGHQFRSGNASLEYQSSVSEDVTERFLKLGMSDVQLDLVVDSESALAISNAELAAEISRRGFAGYLSLSGGDSQISITEGYFITVQSLLLKVNTTDRSVEFELEHNDPVVLEAGTYVTASIDGSLNIHEFTLNGQLMISVERELLRIDLLGFDFEGVGLSAEDPLITINISKLGDALSYEVTVGYSLIVASLDSLVTFLNDTLASQSFYNANIPVINRSLADMTQFVDEIRAAVEQAGQEAPSALAAVELALERAFGLASDDLSLGFDFGTLSFDVDFDWSKSFEQNARFDFDLASYASMAGLDLSALGDMAALTDYLGAGTSGNLQFTAELSLMASLAVDLKPILQGRAPSIRINAFNPSGADGDAEGTRFSVETKILGQDLELAFQVGLIEVGVMEGSVALDGDGNAETSEDSASFVVSLTEDYLLGGDILDYLETDLSGQLHVDLPLSILHEGSVIPLDSFQVSSNPTYGNDGLMELYRYLVDGATSDGGNPIQISFPDITGAFENLFGQFSLLGLLNNPSLVIDGIDLALAAVEGGLDSGLAADLPIVGDHLAGLADFVTSIRTGLVGDLRDTFDGVNPVQWIYDGLLSVLGPEGLMAIKDENPGDAIQIQWVNAEGDF